MPDNGGLRFAGWPNNLHRREAIGRFADAGVSCFEAFERAALPLCFAEPVMDESLAIEDTIKVNRRCGEFHLVIDQCFMLGWATDFDDFHIIGGFEDTVAYVWRLLGHPAKSTA